VVVVCWTIWHKRLVLSAEITPIIFYTRVSVIVNGLGLWCLTPFSTIFPVISWRSVLLMDETRVSGENYRPAASHWQTLSLNVVSSTPRHERDSHSQLKWWQILIAHVVVNPTTIRSPGIVNGFLFKTFALHRTTPNKVLQYERAMYSLNTGPTHLCSVLGRMRCACDL
jgi:hypothetical protein